MKKEYIIPAIIILLAIGTLFTLSMTSTPAVNSSTTVKIATTIFPLSDIAKNVGGDKITVVNILPPGASPHTYELTPSTVKKLLGTTVVFKIGAGLDDWADPISDSIPQSQKIAVSDGINLRPSSDPTESGDDPHYWLAPTNAKIIAANIADQLSQKDPDNQEYYRQNLAAYQAQLDSLYQEITAQLAPLTDHNLVTFHDAWAYFAKDFNLNILATFEPFPGQEPTPQYLQNLGNEIKHYQVKALFAEPQLAVDALNQFIKDRGLALYILDPLGGVTGRQTYADLIRYNAQTVYNALRS
ncbi:MAG: metal ABC transporter substrate-binding protein [Patescibacteria group bacterium]